MTLLEQKQKQLERLYSFRAAALKMNDAMWVHKNEQKIDELEKEIIAIKRQIKGK